MVRITTWLVGGLLLSASCGDEPLTPTAGDRVPEVSVSGTELLSRFTEDGDFLVSPPLEAPDRATVAGLMIDMVDPDAPARFEARGIDRLGRVGDWVKAGLTWSERELRVARAPLGIVAAEVQLRIPKDEATNVAFLVWSAVVPMPPVADAPIAALPRGGIQQRRAALSSALASGGVKSRADWGARPTRCSAQNPVKTMMAVHHTVTPASSSDGFEARIRQIQSFHMDTRGWCDIGYHFLVTIDGSVWEAREAVYLGAHVANHNTNNIGVSFVGCFHPGDATCDSPSFQPNVPPDAMIQGGGHVIGLLANEYGITIDSNTVKGHRDHSGASTACPGDALHSRLPDLRSIAGGVDPGPSMGVATGVVYDLSVTPGPADPGNVRITNAVVRCSNGDQVMVRSSDALWSFDLEPGMYTFTAQAPGFMPATNEVMVTADQTTWGSIGLVPEPMAVELGVHVYDADMGPQTPVEGAEVSLDMVGVELTDADGRVTFDVMPGRGMVTVRAEGYEVLQQEIDFEDPAGTNVELPLVPITVEEPKKPENPEEPEQPEEPVEMMQEQPQDPSRTDVEGGCGCSATQPRAGGSLFLLLGIAGLFFARRR